MVTLEARGCVGALNGCMKKSIIEPKYNKSSVDSRQTLAQTEKAAQLSLDDTLLRGAHMPRYSPIAIFA